jgi:Flp pilus assembly protein TadG
MRDGGRACCARIRLFGLGRRRRGEEGPYDQVEECAAMRLLKGPAFVKRFARAEEGATAVEFAMVVMPFFLFLFAIFDVAMVFFASTTLENGIVTSARQIRTGQAQAANMTAEQFRGLVCGEIDGLLGCDSRLAIDVRKFVGFSDAELPAALDESGNLTGEMKFDPGEPGDVVVVRAFYTWPVMTPVVGEIFTNMAGNRRLLEASIAFRNEPYGSILNN